MIVEMLCTIAGYWAYYLALTIFLGAFLQQIIPAGISAFLLLLSGFIIILQLC